MIRIGSLFSGIGGLELGIEAALSERGIAHHVAWQVERDPFPRSILAKHWPKADRTVEDVTLASASNLAPVDLICGGFPCQDLSYAGKGAGLEGERSGLWSEYRRIVCELRPRIVIVENVAALLTRGVERVLGDLAALGYDARWRCVRASDVGAPHRRERLFIVANRDSGRPQRGAGNVGGEGGEETSGRDPVAVAAQCGDQTLADCDSERRKGSRRSKQARGPVIVRSGEGVADTRCEHGWKGGGNGSARKAAKHQRRSATAREPRIAVSCMGRNPDGISARVDAPAIPDRWPTGPGEAQAEWEPPRTTAKEQDRAKRLKALGNAVVPAVGREVMRWAMTWINVGGGA